jgi:hypothetical protein
MRERRARLADQHGCSLPDVRFWHLADFTAALIHVFAFGGKADIARTCFDVRF